MVSVTLKIFSLSNWLKVNSSKPKEILAKSSSIETTHGVGGIGFSVEVEKLTVKEHQAGLLTTAAGRIKPVNAITTTERTLRFIILTLREL